LSGAHRADEVGLTPVAEARRGDVGRRSSAGRGAARQTHAVTARAVIDTVVRIW
jgi:hypothetical protein